MKSEQKLALKPLCTKDAMVALWRQIRKIKTDTQDDDAVMKAIEELERCDAAEYLALKELCRDEEGCSLGGLPLVLVQAGSYIAQFQCSIAHYHNIFKNSNRTDDMRDIMKNTLEMKPVRESQRSIWTTWRISVGQLSTEAYSVLLAMAMLGPGGVEDVIVKEIVKGVTGDEGGNIDRMFRNVVVEELAHGSSLVCRNEAEGRQEGWMYNMHRLVRGFILSETKRGSELWNEMYCVSLVTLHEVVVTELQKEDKSFEEFPNVFGDSHRQIASHTSALVDHHTLPSQAVEIQHISKVEDIHEYSGLVMEFMGKAEEEVQVWERLATILHHQQAANPRKGCTRGLLDMWHGHRRRKALKTKSHLCTIISEMHSTEMESSMTQFLCTRSVWT